MLPYASRRLRILVLLPFVVESEGAKIKELWIQVDVASDLFPRLPFFPRSQRSWPLFYVFLDSTADVGTSNYLRYTRARANFLHYGMITPTRWPRGGSAMDINIIKKIGMYNWCKFNGDNFCVEMLSPNLCSNRYEYYLFWDIYHPSQAVAEVADSKLLDSSSGFLYPINFRQLTE